MSKRKRIDDFFLRKTTSNEIQSEIVSSASASRSNDEEESASVTLTSAVTSSELEKSVDQMKDKARASTTSGGRKFQESLSEK